MDLDEYIQRIQNFPSWNINAVVDGEPQPWFDVPPEAIVRDLVIQEYDVDRQIALTAAQIMQWGRYAAMTKRVVSIHERRYRVWKARQRIDLIEAAEKKPTEKEIESRYRIQEEYETFNILIDESEEAAYSTEMVLEAFRAKQFLLKSVRRRYDENSTHNNF